ncbi:aldo/keto reductase [Microbacteriaceae bacterium VKM Ac-2854]|nr:aldo/keto reductase [Microbacteriaceae bacterium VKM Ac-2854]
MTAALASRMSALGLGAAPIGNLYSTIDDAAARAAVDAAWAGGVRVFDTAPHYGLGLSERRLGRALAARPRDEYVVSTKVGRLLVPNPTPSGTDLASGFDVPDDLTRVRDYSRDGVLRSLESSLRRLRLDRIDIVYVHDPEDFMALALAQAVPALLDLRDQGVIGAVGVGMNLVAPLRRFVREYALDAVMVAGRWTLADRSAEVLLGECAAAAVTVVAAAPFNSGLLAKDWPPDGAYFDYAPASPARLAQARALARACQNHGVALPHAALRFPLRHPAVACVVAGMRTPGQVRQDVAWMRDPLSDEFWAAVDHWAAG